MHSNTQPPTIATNDLRLNRPFIMSNQLEALLPPLIDLVIVLLVDLDLRLDAVTLTDVYRPRMFGLAEVNLPTLVVCGLEGRLWGYFSTSP